MATIKQLKNAKTNLRYLSLLFIWLGFLAIVLIENTHDLLIEGLLRALISVGIPVGIVLAFIYNIVAAFEQAKVQRKKLSFNCFTYRFMISLLSLVIGIIFLLASAGAEVEAWDAIGYFVFGIFGVFIITPVFLVLSLIDGKALKTRFKKLKNS